MRTAILLALAGVLTAGAVPAGPPEPGEGTDFVGRVHDAVSGVPVEGAQVIVRDSRLGTRTAADGSFRVMSLPDSPGVREVEVSHPCFHTVRIELGRQDLASPLSVGLPFRAPRMSDGTALPIVCEAYGRGGGQAHGVPM
jgi:hypothetical protein